MQKIALGAITGLNVHPATSEVGLRYRRPGLIHVLLSVVGFARIGTVRIDPRLVKVTETSRNRRMAITVPTPAVRTVAFTLARRIWVLAAAILLLLVGGVILAFGIADITGAGWWPELERQPPGVVLETIGVVLLGLGLLELVVFSYRRDLVLVFDTGGAGVRLHLRRSWSLGLPMRTTMTALGLIETIVLDSRPDPRQTHPETQGRAAPGGVTSTHETIPAVMDTSPDDEAADEPDEFDV